LHLLPKVTDGVDIGRRIINMIQTTYMDSAAWIAYSVGFESRAVVLVGRIKRGVIVDLIFVTFWIFEFTLITDHDLRFTPTVPQSSCFNSCHTALQCFGTGGTQHGAPHTIIGGRGEFDRVGFIFVPAT